MYPRLGSHFAIIVTIKNDDVNHLLSKHLEPDISCYYVGFSKELYKIGYIILILHSW